jgi:hypothetical protein
VQDQRGPEVARQRETSDSRKALRRGDRFGKVLVVRQKGLAAEAEIWATQGINECPAASWDALDAETIRSQTAAFRVVLNGPRIWLPNAAARVRPSARRTTFGRLEFGHVATRTLLRGQAAKPYRERGVPRTSTFTFNRGEEVDELVSPHGAA